MAKTNGSGSKHYKSFWPLIIILVIACLMAGLVYWFQFSFSNEQDLNSMVITVHRRVPTTTKKPVSKKPATAIPYKAP